MIRIGVVNIDVSHPRAFAELLEKGSRARYAAVYNDGFRGDDEVEAFIRKFQMSPRCKTVDELAGQVDIGFIQGCDWTRHLDYVEPFFSRNKPVFIDKPIVGSISDCRRVERYAVQGRAILGSSSLRYAREITDFLARPLAERGEILSIYGTCGLDEFNYGIHIVESICGLARGKPLAVRFTGRSVRERMISETFTVQFKHEITATFSTFQGRWMPCVLVIMTTKGTFHFEIDVSKVYQELLDRICDVMEGLPSTLATVDELTDTIKIMLAGRISREREGSLVRIDQIPDDDPGYDGHAFAKGYGAEAKKIYLD